MENLKIYPKVVEGYNEVLKKRLLEAEVEADKYRHLLREVRLERDDLMKSFNVLCGILEKAGVDMDKLFDAVAEGVAHYDT